MTMHDAEAVKQNLEKALNEKSIDGLNDMEVFIAPKNKSDFKSFKKLWRNTTYVVALTTLAHADMNVYVCDKNFEMNRDEFETLDQFVERTGLKFNY